MYTSEFEYKIHKIKKFTSSILSVYFGVSLESLLQDYFKYTSEYEHKYINSECPLHVSLNINS